jgi:valyl-tRNA synthetase
VAIEWYDASCNKLLEIEDNFEKYRISDALMGIYKLVWDDFCSWFLEMIKPAYQQPIDSVLLKSNRNAQKPKIIASIYAVLNGGNMAVYSS